MIYRHNARRLPLLQGLRIASPCTQSWEQMLGNDRVRFCRGCAKNVYNLSAVSREEAETFLQQADRACVRLHRRADGTVVSGDCPAGRRQARVRRAGWVLGLAGIVSAVCSVVAFATSRPATRGTASEAPLGGTPRGLRARAELPRTEMGCVTFSEYPR